MRPPLIHITYRILLAALLIINAARAGDHPFKGNVGDQEIGQSSTNSRWIRPGQSESDMAVWGHSEGIRVGLPPMPGPRGLLRIYTPYLGHKPDKMINFIAIEPIVKGDDQRGFSELEHSQLDEIRGKRLWSANASDSFSPTETLAPGVVEVVEGVETLTVFFHCEPFDNGAKVYVSARFFADRPYEIELATFSRNDSKPLDYFILTATMGNYARLRQLYLADVVKSSLAIWPEYNDIHFTDHDITELKQMIKGKGGNAYFIAATNEVNPSNAKYASGTKDHWKYYGEVATQYWKKTTPDPLLKGLVNGRYAYWASKAPIPGGISFENFELNEPFRQGASFVFGVSPRSPEKFIKNIKSK